MKKKVENKQDSEQLDILAVSSSVSLPKQKRVMFKFDDDEPMHLGYIFEGGEFIIKLKEGYIKFEKGGKTFELYIDEHVSEQLVCSCGSTKINTTIKDKPFCFLCGEYL